MYTLNTLFYFTTHKIYACYYIKYVSFIMLISATIFSVRATKFSVCADMVYYIESGDS